MPAAMCAPRCWRGSTRGRLAARRSVRGAQPKRSRATDGRAHHAQLLAERREHDVRGRRRPAASPGAARRPRTGRSSGVARVGDAATEHDELRVEHVEDRRHGRAEHRGSSRPRRGSASGSPAAAAAATSRARDRREATERRGLAGRQRLARPARDVRPRRVGLEAAATAAGARIPVDVDRQVAELAGVARRAAVRPPVEDEPAADPGRDREVDEAPARPGRDPPRTATRPRPPRSRRCRPRRAPRTRSSTIAASGTSTQPGRWSGPRMTPRSGSSGPPHAIPTARDIAGLETAASTASRPSARWRRIMSSGPSLAVCGLHQPGAHGAVAADDARGELRAADVEREDMVGRAEGERRGRHGVGSGHRSRWYAGRQRTGAGRITPSSRSSRCLPGSSAGRGRRRGSWQRHDDARRHDELELALRHRSWG